jgi:hypothetical protein
LFLSKLGVLTLLIVPSAHAATFHSIEISDYGEHNTQLVGYSNPNKVNPPPILPGAILAFLGVLILYKRK